LAGLPQVIPIGRSNSFKYNEMQPHSVEMMWENKKIILESSNYIGEYNFKDIAMAFALVATLKKNQVEKLLSACGELKPYKFRSQIIENNDQFVFFDAYNANPTSMSLALSAYTNLNKVRHVSLEQSLFVIGQMNELGEGGEAMHRDLALKLNNIGAKHIILIGPKTKLMIDHLDGDTNYFENCENCKIFWATHRRQYKSIFMKGSRTVYLERLLE
jgi:UDP-N-acetylmuramoyl-tripeptide--D-alanyl-D-alanine ligase